VKLGKFGGSTIKRDSNFELLRIISMLMIISYHIVLHCISIQLTDKTSITEWENGWFNQPFFYKKLCILNLILPMGNTANNIFILITGYFFCGGGVDKFLAEG